MVEISGHGGLTAPSAILQALLKAGAREAHAGEFTQRALLHGKIDLLQAEAIGELIEARTEAHRRIALSHVEGSLSLALSGLYEKLLELEALLAYELDFPEEDDGPVSKDAIVDSASSIQVQLEQLLATTQSGQIAQTGAVVVIAGIPNAGKSSLFNALAGEQRAIVTEYPGTTRDAVEVVLDDERIPLRLVDTAGLRDTTDAMERLGIEVSVRYLMQAAVVLLCGERGEDIEEAGKRVAATGTTACVLKVRTKSDQHVAFSGDDDVLSVSALDRSGLGALVGAIRAAVDRRLIVVDPQVPVITRARQQLSLSRARDEIGAFLSAWGCVGVPVIIAAVHVRSAVHALQELIGAIDSDAILGAVFKRFCVGK
jgi:tRNA modification GTPase